MDGDEADLPALIQLKKSYSNILLYIDEAHAFGVRGKKGLGCAEEQDCINDIDFLVGTFGKAIASAGAYIVCRQLIREYLINKMRTFIHHRTSSYQYPVDFVDVRTPFSFTT